MCEVCNQYTHGTNMVQIDETILETFILASGLTVKEIQELNLTTQSVTPTFKPNPNLGEGTASKDEVDYRQKIIDGLKPIDKRFKELKDTKLSPDQVIDEIDTLCAEYIKDTQAIVTKQVTARYQDGYNKMNDYILKAGVHAPTQDPIQPRLQSILRQQLQNIEDIGLRLRGRLRQIVNIKDVWSYYQQKPIDLTQTLTDDEGEYYIDPKTKKKIYISSWDDDSDSAISDAQNNSDSLGLYGFIVGYNSGFLESGLYASALVTGAGTLLIKIPWVTVGDENVCDECESLESEGPFSIWDYPAYPHFGCRCEPGEPEITWS